MKNSPIRVGIGCRFSRGVVVVMALAQTTMTTPTASPPEEPLTVVAQANETEIETMTEVSERPVVWNWKCHVLSRSNFGAESNR